MRGQGEKGFLEQTHDELAAADERRAAEEQPESSEKNQVLSKAGEKSERFLGPRDMENMRRSESDVASSARA